jgi:hypothetical protein
MHIALLISGRITRYEVCLLPILLNSGHHKIDLFISVNDKNENGKYYDKMKEDLKEYIKFLKISEFVIDDEIFNLFNPNKSNATHGMQVNLQKVNNKYVPNNALSMYYNDMVAFNEACNYADINNFEYDIFLKFRSDIIAHNIPINICKPEKKIIHLYSHEPLCSFISGGIYKKNAICDCYAWGNRESMKIYCNTYNYVISKIKEFNGEYYVAGECSLTDNIYENKVPHSFHHCGYRLDKNRRMFDDVTIDSRAQIHNQTIFSSSNRFDNSYIPPEKQE